MLKAWSLTHSTLAKWGNHLEVGLGGKKLGQLAMPSKVPASFFGHYKESRPGLLCHMLYYAATDPKL